MDIGTEIKYLFDYDVSHIKNCISGLSVQDWQFNPLRQKTFRADHGRTESIILIWGKSNQKVSTSKELNDAVYDVGVKIKNYYGNNSLITTLMLVKLFGNSEIPEHNDGGILTEIHRCHLPIITNENCEFYINKKKFFFEEGKVIEFNNVMQHSVINNSNVDRVHLICDIYARN